LRQPSASHFAYCHLKSSQYCRVARHVWDCCVTTLLNRSLELTSTSIRGFASPSRGAASSESWRERAQAPSSLSGMSFRGAVFLPPHSCVCHGDFPAMRSNRIGYRSAGDSSSRAHPPARLPQAPEALDKSAHIIDRVASRARQAGLDHRLSSQATVTPPSYPRQRHSLSRLSKPSSAHTRSGICM
jgi:hypothetical protein